ncbi:MAG: hypothetical protein A49_02580 [Methyloceanibacter sp.]|nr:MAG: hypothetical protein A49_02580 [Methyloceanibacter sp.]
MVPAAAAGAGSIEAAHRNAPKTPVLGCVIPAAPTLVLCLQIVERLVSGRTASYNGARVNSRPPVPITVR